MSAGCMAAIIAPRASGRMPRARGWRRSGPSPAADPRSIVARDTPKGAASTSASCSGPKPGVWAVSSTKPFGRSTSSASLAEQGSEVVLEPPPTTPRAVAVTRRVEHDRRRSAGRAEPRVRRRPLRVVDDPADRPPREPRQLRVPPRPGDRRPGCVDVNHRGALCRRDQRRQAGVREQVEHGHALGDPVPEPLPRALLFGEQAHLARRGRSQLDGQPVHVGPATRPGCTDRSRGVSNRTSGRRRSTRPGFAARRSPRDAAGRRDATRTARGAYRRRRRAARSRPRGHDRAPSARRRRMAGA